MAQRPRDATLLTAPLAQVSLLATLLALIAASYATGPTPVIAVAAAALYVTLGLVLWTTSQIHFLLILPFYFGYLTAVISNVYLEYGTYISEQHRYSFPTGSTLRLVAFAAVFFVTAFVAARRTAPTSVLQHQARQPETPQLRRFVMNSIVLVVVVWLLALVGSGLLFGFPLFLRIDRFTYWSIHPLPQLWRLLIHGMQLAFLLGIVFGFSASTRRRRIVLLLFGAMLTTNVMFGDKFSSSALAIIHFITAIGLVRCMRSDRGVRLRNVIPAAVVLAGAFFLLVSWSYSNISDIAPHEVVDYIVARALALQGHTWWGIDYLVLQGQTDGVSPAQLLRPHEPMTPGGLYLLMYALAPASSVAAYMERGITFTMGGTAIAVYTLGYGLALIYVAVAGTVTGLMLGYLGRKVAQVHLWRAWVALKVLWIALLAFNMGNAYLLLSLSMVFYLGIIAADLLRQGMASPSRSSVPPIAPRSSTHRGDLPNGTAA